MIAIFQGLPLFLHFICILHLLWLPLSIILWLSVEENVNLYTKLLAKFKIYNNKKEKKLCQNSENNFKTIKFAQETYSVERKIIFLIHHFMWIHMLPYSHFYILIFLSFFFLNSNCFSFLSWSFPHLLDIALLNNFFIKIHLYSMKSRHYNRLHSHKVKISSHLGHRPQGWGRN